MTDVSETSGMIADRARGCILAMAAGDALGSTIEFRERDTVPEVRDLIGGGAFRLPPGTWTDDTSMALCLADSLIAHPEFDPHDLMRRFVNWYRYGHNSATGRCFDIGGTTKSALWAFEKDQRMAGEGPIDEWSAGNGSLMRLAPVALAFAGNLDEARSIAARQSMTTHASKIAAAACDYMVTMLVEALNGADRDQVLMPRKLEQHELVDAIALGSWRTKTRDQIESTGFVLHTLEAALWAVGSTNSLEDALILAANLGDDADTVAAIAGQLAGALYGAAAIPRRWLDKLVLVGRLELCVDNLIGVGNGRSS